MSKLILEGKKLSTLIARNRTSREKLNADMHIYICSAVHLAVRDGRTSWLNEIYLGFSALEQSAFRAWLAPISKAWFRGNKENIQDVAANQVRKWLKYDQKGGFKINTTERLWKLDAPTAEEIEAVSESMGKSMFAERISGYAKQFKLDDIFGKIDALIKQVEKERKDGNVLTDDITIRKLEETKAMLKRNVKAGPKLITVDGVNVEDTAEEPVVPTITAEIVPAAEVPANTKRKARGKAA